MFGIPEGTPLTNDTFLAAVHPADREYVDRQWTAALRGKPYDIEHRILVGDKEKWVRERAELEFDSEGMLRGGFGTTQDITERKEAEEALRQSEEKHKRLIETTNTGYVIIDDQGRVIDANQEYARLTGRRRIEDVVGHSVLEWTSPGDVKAQCGGGAGMCQAGLCPQPGS